MISAAPNVVPLKRKTRKKGKRRRGGIRRRGNRLTAYVKVGTLQRSHDFPLGTPEWDIEKWIADTFKELKELRPVAGSLGAAIDRFLAGLPEGRRKDDIADSLLPWKKALGHKQIGAVSVTDLAAQFSAWQSAGLAGSTLNHRRQALLTLWGPKQPKRRNATPGLGLSTKCPAADLPKFAEGKPRQGFFEHDKFIAVLAQLRPDYADVVEFAYYSGWRRQEIQRLVWSEVDIQGGVIRLSPERSKNDEGRVLPLVGSIKDVIDRRLKARVEGGITHKERGKTVTRDYVFFYKHGGKRTAAKLRPIGEWRKEWRKACEAAYGRKFSWARDAAADEKGPILHDFRRTVVRNLERARVPRKVAMQLTGHKTEAVFRRYDIVNEADLKQASERPAAHLNGQQP